MRHKGTRFQAVEAVRLPPNTTSTIRLNPGTRSWIRQPLVDLAAIEARQMVVGAFVSDQIAREGVREQLKVYALYKQHTRSPHNSVCMVRQAVPDLELLARKMQRSAKLENVYSYYVFAKG